MATFQEVLTAAVKDLTEHGFDSAERLEKWQLQLERAAQVYAGVGQQAEQMIRSSLTTIYTRLIEQGGILKYHPGIERYTLNKLAPHLRGELHRRILASTQLIKLDKAESIQKTLRRFSGWATSVPVGGTDVADKVEIKKTVSKAMQSLPYVERRVAIDQGHKLRASLSEIVALDNEAIACKWHSHAGEAGYNYRPAHAARNDHIYLIKGNWAQEKGLVKPGPDGYYEDITSAGSEINCRCWVTWLYTLRKMPEDMLTAKGKEALSKPKP